MAEYNPNEVHAPVYRYFAVDVMSNKILMEIPFQKVSYERALKAAGEFQGQIPVIERTRSLDLYENTMPGQTAIYVVRDGVCVWGGIIWSRSYGVKDKVLQVSASEFTSYFHHRLIWKTFNFQYGASIDVSASPAVYHDSFSYNMATNPNNYDVQPANNGTTYTAARNYTTVGTPGTGSTFSGRMDTQGSSSNLFPLAPTRRNFSQYAWLKFGTGATNTGGIRYTSSVVANQPYNFSLYTAATQSNTVRLRATFVDSTGTAVGSTFTSNDVALAANTWTQLVVAGAVSPATATRVYLDVYAPAGAAWTSGGSLGVTGLRVAPTYDATDFAYFDGYSNSTTLTSYSWDGTPGSTTSTATTQILDSAGGVGGTTTVTLDSGTAKDVVVGAKVELEFYEPENFGYNGYYKVVQRDSPTASTFEIDSGVVSNIVSIGSPGFQGGSTNYFRVFAITDAPHGYTTGDTVTITGSPIARYNGVWVITAVDGPGSKQFYFTLPFQYRMTTNPGSASSTLSYAYPRTPMRDVSGVTASRYLPAGATFDNVTLSVHTDTYDYIRGLISSVWDDFADIEFADDYLTPGVEEPFRIASYQLGEGYATITTTEAHGLVVGQSVSISQLGKPFDGQWTVAGVPSPTSFAYELSGTLPLTTPTVYITNISRRWIANGVAYISYAPSSSVVNGQYQRDQYALGDTIVVPQTEDFDGLSDIFTGAHVIEYQPKPGVIGWSTTSTATSSPASPAVGSVTVRRPYVSTSGGNLVNTTASWSLGTPVGFSLSSGLVTVDFGTTLLQDASYTNSPKVGDSVNLSLPYAMPVTQKSIDGPNSIKSIETSVPHNLDVGDLITINGDSDVYAFESVQYRTNNTFTITTSTPHNIRKGQRVLLRDMVDKYSASDVRLLSIKDNYANVLVNGGNHNVTYPYWYGGSLRAPLSQADGANIPNAVSADADTTTMLFQNFYSYFNVKSIAIRNNVATLVTHTSNTFLVNDTITLSGLSESAKVVNKEIRDGIIILTTDGPHNIQVSDQITVSGLGAPYDSVANVSTVVLSVTETRILYQVSDELLKKFVTASRIRYVGASQVNIAPTKANGLVKTSNSTLNGNFVVTAKPSINTITFNITANDADTRTFAASSKVDVGGESILRFAAPSGYTFDADGNPVSVIGMKIGTTSQRILSIPLLTGLTQSIPIPDIPTEIAVGNSRDTTVERAGFLTTSPVSDDAAAFNYQTYGLASQSGWEVLSSTQNSFTCKWYPHTPTYYNDTNDTIFWPTNPNPYNNAPVTSFKSVSVKSGVGTAVSPSAIAGEFLVTEVVSDYRVNSPFTPANLSYYSKAPIQNVLETATNNSAFFRMQNGTILGSAAPNFGGGGSGVSAGVAGAVSGSGVISAIDWASNTITVTLDYARTFGSAAIGTPASGTSAARYGRNGKRYHKNIPYQTLATQNTFSKTPVVTVGTYGPFPGNGGLGMTFSTSQYSGVDVTPTPYRGYALTNVGDALDAYSGTTNGFEYRIDCAYDADRDEFTRTFVLIPINFPDPPNAGEVSDPSRFGADKLVFEYPGSVMDVKLDESAENSATRFFAVGDADLGEDAADPYSAASNLDFLDAENARKWPLLDDHESIKDVSDKDILYSFAEQYLNESRPPEAEFTISVNGSLQPPVNTYLPGNWCSIIVNDDFIKARLAAKLEPRDTVLVRKIDSYKVSVPDGITFPETVELTLVAEWDVDKKTT